MKLYTNRPDHFFYFTAKIVVEQTQANVQTVLVSQEEQDSADFKNKRQHGHFPMLELQDGSMIYESFAIANYLANISASHGKDLSGHNAFEQA